MRRDSVTVRERAVIFRNHPAIGQQNGIALNRPHLDEFAVDKFLPPVRLQQQPVTSGHLQLPFLSHIKQGKALTQWENTFGTVRALDFQGVIFNGDHRNRFIFGKTSFLPVKPNRQAGTILPRIPLLRFRP